MRLELQTPQYLHQMDGLHLVFELLIVYMYTCQLACVYLQCNLVPVALNCQEGDNTSAKYQQKSHAIIKIILQPCLIIHSRQITICHCYCALLSIHCTSMDALPYWRESLPSDPPPPKKKRKEKERKCNMKHKNVRMKSKLSRVYSTVSQTQFTRAFKYFFFLCFTYFKITHSY